MKSLFIIALLILPSFLGVSGCKDGPMKEIYPGENENPNSNSPQTPKDDDQDLSLISLLTDKTFANGLQLVGNNSGNPSTGKILSPFGKPGTESHWKLAEWASNFLLNQNERVELNGNAAFENEGKMISFRKDNKSMEITMEVKASAEYGHPRKLNEPWPHLLIEQSFTEKPKVEKLDSLILTLNGKLLHSYREMQKEAMDPGLHTAQFQIFLTLQNLNPLSDGYGDFLWFGVPFYDYRYKEIASYAAQDIGKGDASGKFIYSIGTTDYMQGSFHDNNWKDIRVNLMPFLLTSISVAKTRGYLTTTNLEDFRISGMNLGWEVPGTFDVSFVFNNFDIRYALKKG